MKAVAIALVILIFNIMISSVTHSDLFGNTGMYYESSYYDAYSGQLTQNVSATEESQQYAISMNNIGVIFGSLSWNWIYQFLPLELHSPMSWFINGLNILSGLIISIAFIELFMKRSII